MKKLIFLLLLILIGVPRLGSAQNLIQFSKGISSPEDLSVLLTRDFKYKTEYPDFWQPASETLRLKSGDCEDFAVFSQAVLSRLNIPSSILIIKFRGLGQMHAICIFRKGRYYSFISNRKLIDTQTTTVKEALSQYYPDWETITVANNHRQFLTTIMRCATDSGLEMKLAAYFKQE